MMENGKGRDLDDYTYARLDGESGGGGDGWDDDRDNGGDNQETGMRKGDWHGGIGLGQFGHCAFSGGIRFIGFGAEGAPRSASLE